MSTKTVSPLRHRMIEDMSLRNLAPRTQEHYIRSCKKLAAFLRRSPDTATAEDIRLFQLHLAEQGVSICSRNRTMTGVAFLFRVTLRHPEIADQIEYIVEPQKIPVVLSPEEVRRLLDAAPAVRDRESTVSQKLTICCLTLADAPRVVRFGAPPKNRSRAASPRYGRASPPCRRR